ncbi:uncharacterized protein K460DRAFT_357990 [Cucurbitaria berberidis CBS 394.84]|uniref:BTB domain-containing protein n=1 Tax=Cucurbitaria berberidis CBS 394.84 TaxID=1168544 RepID=A0A9P4L7K0_9PLEO|nr:uncharacterized protein K460DRAFT_357990 [Cucurbitaria berberidis CBS 394.84]KAF1844384.1 hypothetical protein K460DRAFT_357990 [Cucurbitaria berberidis CBS 394.84]
MSASDRESRASESSRESSTTPEPPRKKIRFSTHEGPQIELRPITIRVGSTDDEFYIHEKLLRSTSSFFDNALKEGWKEGQGGIIRLSEVEPAIFTIWTKWLYTGRMFVMKDGDDRIGPDGDSYSGEWDRLRDCYASGDFLQDSDFKDATIDALVTRMVETDCYPLGLARYIYDYSNKGSAHRQLAIDTCVRVWDRDDYADLLTEDEFNNAFQPRQFLCDVLAKIGPNLETGIKEKDAGKFFDLNDTCKYHDHGSDKPCYKMKPAFNF